MWMNRWLWPDRGLGISLMMLIITLNMINVTAARDHTPRHSSVGAESGISAVQPVSILPVGHSVGVDAVAFAPDGMLIASGNVDNLVRLWYTQTGKLWRTLTGHSSGVTSVAFSPDSSLVASGSEDNSVWLWDVHTGMVLQTLASVGRAEKSPEVLLSYQQPGGQGRALRGSVIAGIPQT